ncbi:MAG: hypothetical protein M3Z66_12010 [Chloroflexota bacterium]|nr:hypothetical protein [Chloroflexota bacterium]
MADHLYHNSCYVEYETLRDISGISLVLFPPPPQLIDTILEVMDELLHIIPQGASGGPTFRRHT